MRFLKRLLSCAAAACVAAAGSVTAFAFTEVPISNGNGDWPVFTVRDGNTYVEVVPIAKESEANKAIWLDAMAAVTGDKSKYDVLIMTNKTDISIYLAPIGSIQTPSVSSNFFTFSPFPCYQIFIDRSQGSLRVLFYTKPSTFVLSVPKYYHFLMSSFVLPDSALVAVPAGRLYFVDDIRDPEPPPDPPDPPESSLPPDPPEEPFNPAGPPSKPPYSGSYDPPYDLSVQDSLMYYLRDTTGSVGSVMIPAIFLVAALVIIWAAVRHYLSRGSSDGGGNGLL